MGFSFVRIFVILELKDNISDRYVLFGLRNGWQKVFRQALGCSRNCCGSCLNKECPGFLAFSQSLTPDPAALCRFQKPSPPFIFDIPILPELPNKQSSCAICLTLVGNAIHDISTYLAALQLYFNNVVPNLQVVGVQTGGYQNQRYSLYPEKAEGSVVILSDEGLLQSTAFSPYDVSIHFITPLRLLRDGKPVRVLSPSLLLRSLLRRISSLAYYYGGVELDADFKWLARQSDQIVVKDDCLTWVDLGRNLSGLVGCMTLVGSIVDFHYFLALGEYLHLGKGAAFGLGKYVLHHTPVEAPVS